MNSRQGNRLRGTLVKSAVQKYNQNNQNQASSAFGLLNDMAGSNSYNHGSFSSSGIDAGSCFSIDICPDLVLALVAALAALASYLIYNAITVAGKRKKRSEEVGFFSSVADAISPSIQKLGDFAILGISFN